MDSLSYNFDVLEYALFVCPFVGNTHGESVDWQCRLCFCTGLCFDELLVSILSFQLTSPAIVVLLFSMVAENEFLINQDFLHHPCTVPEIMWCPHFCGECRSLTQPILSCHWSTCWQNLEPWFLDVHRLSYLSYVSLLWPKWSPHLRKSQGASNSYL